MSRRLHNQWKKSFSRVLKLKYIFNIFFDTAVEQEETSILSYLCRLVLQKFLPVTLSEA